MCYLSKANVTSPNLEQRTLIKDGFKGILFLDLMNARPSWMFCVCKKQQYQGEIVLVTNLRPLMSEQLLIFSYILYSLNIEYIS